MKIITGEMAVTKGQIKICGYNVTNNQSEAFKMLGYCPQVKNLTFSFLYLDFRLFSTMLCGKMLR